MKKIDSKIVPMNVASLNLEFVMDSNGTVTCIVRTPQGAVLDVNSDMDSLSESITEIVKLAIEQIENVSNHE